MAMVQITHPHSIFIFSLTSCISSSRNYDNGGTTSTTNVVPSGDYSHGNPLAHLSESVNAIDPLNAIEKTINEVCTHAMPHTYE